MVSLSVILARADPDVLVDIDRNNRGRLWTGEWRAGVASLAHCADLLDGQHQQARLAVRSAPTDPGGRDAWHL
jgi:hypothetical protein